MSLFEKSSAKTSSSCSCGRCPATAAETAAAGKTPLLAVLGSGCSRCKELLANTREALSAEGIAVEPEYITDLKTIMSFGVMSLPALVIRGRAVSAGRVLKQAEIGKLLHENFA